MGDLSGLLFAADPLDALSQLLHRSLFVFEFVEFVTRAGQRIEKGLDQSRLISCQEGRPGDESTTAPSTKKRPKNVWKSGDDRC